MRFSTVLIATSALALAACGDSETTVDDPSDPEQLAAASENLPTPQPGEYRTTGTLVEFDLPGAPAEEVEMMRGFMEMGAAQTQTMCITEEQAEKGFDDFLSAMQDLPDDCAFSEFTVSGDMLDATMSCDDNSGSSGTVHFAGTVTETSQDMTVSMDMNDATQGRAMRMVIRNQTERVGDCSAESEAAG
ncbi:DUF3617 domain-containing protein [Erythrobacter alti]|uniref:DUF3617 domain-containing protein n=1 Tax=Erythrobacter alti TaxID=1896145 RepID=UPI0030F3EAA5